jgi:hypothetical protein
VFNDGKAPVVQTDKAPAFPSTRNSSVIRRPDNSQRLALVAAATPVESAMRSNSHDRSVTVMGIVFCLIFAMSAFTALAHVWVNAGMIR